MIELMNTVSRDGQNFVRQSLVKPAVYLDTWAIIELSEDGSLGSRFQHALIRAGGTLVLSPLSIVDFAGMNDPRHATQAAELIGSIAPNLFFSHFDPFIVRDREYAVMAGQTTESPAGDTGLLAKFAADAKHRGMAQCIISIFNAMYRERAELRAHRDAMGAALFAGIEALRKRIEDEPSMAADVRSPLKDADRARATHALLRLFVGEMQADRLLSKKPNHAIDFLQCVVPASYCSYVLVDAQWYARLTRAKKLMTARGMLAQIAIPFTKKGGGLESFLQTLEAEPAARS